MVTSFTRPSSPSLLFLGYAKRESVLDEDHGFKPHERTHLTSQCAEIDGNADLFHRVHLNFAKRIKLCIENDGNHV